MAAPATVPVRRTREVDVEPRLNTSYDDAFEMLNKRLDFDADIDGSEELEEEEVRDNERLDGVELLHKLQETSRVFKDKRDWYRGLKHRYFQRLAKVEIMLTELEAVTGELDSMTVSVENAIDDPILLREMNRRVITVGLQYQQRLEAVMEVLQEEESLPIAVEDEEEKKQKQEEVQVLDRRPQTVKVTRHVPRLSQGSEDDIPRAPWSEPAPNRRQKAKPAPQLVQMRTNLERQLDEVDQLENTINLLKNKLTNTLDAITEHTVNADEEEEPEEEEGNDLPDRSTTLREQIRELIETKAELEDLRLMELYSRNLPPNERKIFLDDILARLEYENENENDNDTNTKPKRSRSRPLLSILHSNEGERIKQMLGGDLDGPAADAEQDLDEFDDLELLGGQDEDEDEDEDIDLDIDIDDDGVDSLGEVQLKLYERVKLSIEKYGDSPEFLLHVYREVAMLPEEDPLRLPLLNLLFDARGKQLSRAAEERLRESQVALLEAEKESAKYKLKQRRMKEMKEREELEADVNASLEHALSDDENEERIGYDIDDMVRRGIDEDSGDESRLRRKRYEDEHEDDDEEEEQLQLHRSKLDIYSLETMLDRMTRDSNMAGDGTPLLGRKKGKGKGKGKGKRGKGKGKGTGTHSHNLIPPIPPITPGSAVTQTIPEALQVADRMKARLEEEMKELRMMELEFGDLDGSALAGDELDGL